MIHVVRLMEISAAQFETQLSSCHQNLSEYETIDWVSIGLTNRKACSLTRGRLCCRPAPGPHLISAHCHQRLQNRAASQPYLCNNNADDGLRYWRARPSHPRVVCPPWLVVCPPFCPVVRSLSRTPSSASPTVDEPNGSLDEPPTNHTAHLQALYLSVP